MDNDCGADYHTALALQDAVQFLVAPDPVAIYLNDVWFPVEDSTIWGEPRSKFIWLYVISCGDFTKIGLSQDVLNRLAGLTGSAPYDMILHNAFRVPRALSRRAEAYCHAKLMQWHHRGEWFGVSPDNVMPIVEAIAKLACTARKASGKKLLAKKHEGRIIELPAPQSLRHVNREQYKWETRASLPPQPAPPPPQTSTAARD